jgi:DNA polymerase I
MTLQASLSDKSHAIEEDLQRRYPPVTDERYSEKTGKRLKDKVTIFNPASRQQIAARLHGARMGARELHTYWSSPS